MTTFIFANNINAELAGGISSAETTLTLNSTLNLPTSIPSGSVLALTLCNATATTPATVYEIVYVTAISGATLTVIRAQEGTSAQTWLTGNAAFSGPTAGQMQSFIQGSSSGVTPGAYGTSTSVSTFTVNANGIVTAASNTAIAFPITSFNGRGGSVTLTAGDVTTALGFNPLGSAIAATTLLGNPTGSSASPTTITLANGLQFASGALGLGAITPASVNTGVITGSTASLTGALNCAGITSTGANIAVSATQPAINIVNTSSGGTTWTLQSSATGQICGAGALLFYNQTSGGELMTLSTGGVLTIFGNNSNGNTLIVEDTATGGAAFGGITLKSTNGSTNPNKTWRANGSTGNLELVNSAYNSVVLTISDTGVMNRGSDRGIKKNFIERDPAFIHRCWFGDFDYRYMDGHGIGLIAQDVQKNMPHHVTEDDLVIDGKHRSVLKVNFEGVILEQCIYNGRRSDAHELRLESLEARISNLEAA